MTTNLLELQEMFRNFNMGDVQKGARGESGKAAQLIALSELEHRLDQQKAYAAELEEQGTDDPPLVDQYLAASQQMMGQAPPAPPQMPQQMPPQQQGIGSIPGVPYGPMSGGDPRAGSGHGMPPQMPMGQPRPQMPTQMMASGGEVVSVPGGDAMEYGATSQEELEEDDPGFLMDSLQWATDNPADAALLGIDVVAAGAMLAGPLGWSAGVGLKGLSMAARAARVLGPKALKFLRNPVKTVGNARMGRARAGFDSGVDGAGRARAMEQRLNMPGSMKTIYKDGKFVQVPRTDSEMVSRLGRGALLPVAGAGLMGINALVRNGDEEEAPSMLEGDSPGQVPLGALPMQPTDGGLQIGDQVGIDLPDGDEDTEGRSLKEKFDDGKFNNIFQFMTRAGLGLAAGKGDNIGQDIAEASMSGMDYLTEMRNMEREQDRQSAAVLIRADQGDRDQARLEIEQENAPYQRRLLEANTAAAGQRGRMNESSAIGKANQMIEDLMDSGAMRPFEEKVGREGFPILAAQLATFLRQYDTPTEALKALYDTNGVEMPPSMSVLMEEEAQIDSVLSGGA